MEGAPGEVPDRGWQEVGAAHLHELDVPRRGFLIVEEAYKLVAVASTEALSKLMRGGCGQEGGVGSCLTQW